jgi:hypothetical protein
MNQPNKEHKHISMKKIHNSRDLKEAIAELELKKDAQELILKNQFRETYQAYKPASLLKNTIQEVSESPQFRNNLLNIAIGLGAGYLSKRMVIGKSAGLFKKAAGTALQYGITALVTKKAHDVEEYNKNKKKTGFFRKIFSR